MLLTVNFSQYLKATVVGFICATLIACSATPQPNATRDFYQLQAIPLALQHKVFLESLTFKQPEKRQLLTQIETKEATLNLAAMTFSGLAIMQAQWHQDNGLLKFSSQVFDEGMLLRILRDIQLVKWPENAIKAGLVPGYQLITKGEGDNKIREIKSEKQVDVNITYTHKKVVLTNFVEHYELVIERINE